MECSVTGSGTDVVHQWWELLERCAHPMRSAPPTRVTEAENPPKKTIKESSSGLRGHLNVQALCACTHLTSPCASRRLPRTSTQ